MDEEGGGDAGSLEAYLEVLRRRWTWLVAGAGAGLLLAAVYLVITPTTATSTATVQLSVVGDDPLDTGTAAANLIDAATEAELVVSDAVLEAAGAAIDVELGDMRERTSAVLVDESVLMRISFEAADEEAAVAGANAAAEAYLARRRAFAEQMVQARTTTLDQRTVEARARFAEAAAAVTAAAPASADLAAAQAEQELARSVLSEITSAAMSLANVDVGGGRVLRPAGPSTTTIGPPTLTTLASGVVLGALIATVAAYLVRRGGPSRGTAQSSARPDAAAALGTFTAASSGDVRAAVERIVGVTGEVATIVVVGVDGAPSERVALDMAQAVAMADPVDVVFPGEGDVLSSAVAELALEPLAGGAGGVLFESTSNPLLRVFAGRKAIDSADPMGQVVNFLRASQRGRRPKGFTLVALSADVAVGARRAAFRHSDYVVLVADPAAIDGDAWADALADAAAISRPVLGSILVESR